MKASLRKLLCERAGNNDGPARPDWDDESVPMCSESCVHNDGKRCKVLRFRAPSVCEPVVGEMAKRLEDLES